MGLGLPYLKGLTGLELQDGLAVVAAGTVFGFVLAVAAVLGATLIPGDLANRRLAFYFDRPVGTGTLLWGRFLGAWILAVGGGAVVALVQAMAHPATLAQWAGAVGFLAVLALPVLLLSHLAGMAWHTRSPWLLLNLASLGSFGCFMAWLVGRITDVGAFGALYWFLGGALVLGTLVLAVAIHLQMAWGRVEAQRSHRVLSLAVTAGLVAVAAAGALFTGWVRTDGPGTLTRLLAHFGLEGPLH